MTQADRAQAAAHAEHEIRYAGRWTCPCCPCVLVRASIFLTIRVGECKQCQGKTPSRRADYCSSACKQQAYRHRKEEATK